MRSQKCFDVAGQISEKSSITIVPNGLDPWANEMDTKLEWLLDSRMNSNILSSLSNSMNSALLE